MTWTYGGKPESSNTDAVRFLIGDTDSTDPLVQDGEISFTLSQHANNIYKAASLCCTTIATKFARLADTSIETLKVAHHQKHDQYKAMADTLWEQAKKTISPIPFVGGVSNSEIDSVRSDSDRYLSRFRDNLFDNHRAGPSPSTELVVLDET